MLKQCDQCGRVFDARPPAKRCSKECRKAYERACNFARKQTPEYKAYDRAYKQTPEYKAYERARNQTPERKAYDRAGKAEVGTDRKVDVARNQRDRHGDCDHHIDAHTLQKNADVAGRREC